MRILGGALALLLATSLHARAQEPSPSPSPVVPSAPAAPEYSVGPGDVLDVTVFGNDDLSRITTVQTSGTIALPLLGEVAVGGLTVTEIQQQLTTLLRIYLVKPQVEVRVKEYLSQFVSMVGEVNSPGRKPLRGHTRLIDILVDGGGFTTHASGEVVITRTDGTFERGTTTLRMRLGSTPTAQDQINLQVPLKNGDIITASPKFYVTVEGEVTRPGRFEIDGELTVTGAISLAGGLTRFGSNDLKIRRVRPDTLKAQIIEVDFNAVRKGESPDITLQPNDVVSVSRRRF